MCLIFTKSLTGFSELIEDEEVFFFKGFFPLIISDANLTEDLEQVESESDTFLSPFVTGPFLIIPLVEGLAVGLSFSEGAEG